MADSAGNQQAAREYYRRLSAASPSTKPPSPELLALLETKLAKLPDSAAAVPAEARARFVETARRFAELMNLAEYDLPETSPPPAEPNPRPLASAANGALPTPQPTRPSILVDAPAEENARIAWLLERLGSAITQLSMLKQAAGDDQSKLLRALESLAVDGPRGKGSKPGLFAAVVSHRLTVLQRGS